MVYVNPGLSLQSNMHFAVNINYIRQLEPKIYTLLVTIMAAILDFKMAAIY